MTSPSCSISRVRTSRPNPPSQIDRPRQVSRPASGCSLTMVTAWVIASTSQPLSVVVMNASYVCVLFHDDFTLGLVATMGKCQTRQQGSVCDIYRE
jgi:hypothetical protein